MLDVIETIECTREGGPRVNVFTGHYVLNANRVSKNSYEATVLVHEACHIHQYLQGRTYHAMTALELERECAEVQLDAALRLAPKTGIPRYLRGLLDNIDSKHGQWW